MALENYAHAVTGPVADNPATIPESGCAGFSFGSAPVRQYCPSSDTRFRATYGSFRDALEKILFCTVSRRTGFSVRIAVLKQSVSRIAVSLHSVGAVLAPRTGFINGTIAVSLRSTAPTSVLQVRLRRNPVGAVLAPRTGFINGTIAVSLRSTAPTSVLQVQLRRNPVGAVLAPRTGFINGAFCHEIFNQSALKLFMLWL